MKNKTGSSDVMVNWRAKMRHNKLMMNYLCKALTELNRVFSVPSFIFLLLRLISSTFNLYVTIFGLITTNPYLQSLVPATSTIAVVGFLSILVVFHSADIPIHQVGVPNSGRRFIQLLIFNLNNHSLIGRESSRENLWRFNWRNKSWNGRWSWGTIFLSFI